MPRFIAAQAARVPFHCLLWLCLLGATTCAQYRFDHWTADNGLPQNTVQALLKTRDGYLWLATSDGLARFDGVRFTVFNKANTPALLSNHFWSMYEDRAGVLWIAGTGLIRYQQGDFTVFAELPGQTDKEVRGVIGDASGRLWCAAIGRFCNSAKGSLCASPGLSRRAHSINSRINFNLTGPTVCGGTASRSGALRKGG
jgi:ligand-binding sensor domain-containing protein